MLLIEGWYAAMGAEYDMIYEMGIAHSGTKVSIIPRLHNPWPGKGVAFSDRVTRRITGSAAAPLRYAQVSVQYCRLLSGHPLGEMPPEFKHSVLHVSPYYCPCFAFILVRLP